MAGDKSITKVTVNLPTEEVDFLNYFANEAGFSVTQALREAIAHLKWIFEEIRAGGKILVECSDGSIHEVIFPWNRR